MKNKLVVQVVAIVVLLGGAAGGWWFVQRSGEEARIHALEDEAKRLSLEERPDRESISAHLRNLAKHPLADKEPRLLRARARLELALDRPQKALDALEAMVHGVDSSVDDLVLSADILGRMHALGGRADDAFRAMTAAESASEKRLGDARLLLQAWQYAVRSGHLDDAKRIADKLQKLAPESPEARIVAALVGFEATNLQGLAGLLDLEQALGHFEPELGIAIVTLQLQKSDESALSDAVDRVKVGLRLLPASVEMRHVAAAAFHARADQAQRDVHLRWLLENAASDARAERWRHLLATPVGR